MIYFKKISILRYTGLLKGRIVENLNLCDPRFICNFYFMVPHTGDKDVSLIDRTTVKWSAWAPMAVGITMTTFAKDTRDSTRGAEAGVGVARRRGL